MSISSAWPITETPFQPTRTLHAQVLDHLGLEIASGKLEVGHQLPPEDALAAELGISKGGLREVIKALASKGMISVRPRTGTVVNPRHEWVLFDPQVLDWHTSLRGVPLAADLLELRLFVEPQASRLACMRASNAEIQKMAQAYERMDRSFHLGASGLEEFLAADLEFHQALLNASGNELIGQLGRLFAGVLRNGFDMTFHVGGSVERSLPLHKEVSDAIVDRDAERAERASLNLLMSTSEELKNAEGTAS
jgi:DNA-binding FadR family transcriptional regulator